jgi:uncharacterized membrane protein
MNTYGGDVGPFWRTVVGACAGAVIGGVWVLKGFWAAVLVLLCIVVGAVVGAIASGPVSE